MQSWNSMILAFKMMIWFMLVCWQMSIIMKNLKKSSKTVNSTKVKTDDLSFILSRKNFVQFRNQSAIRLRFAFEKVFFPYVKFEEIWRLTCWQMSNLSKYREPFQFSRQREAKALYFFTQFASQKRLRHFLFCITFHFLKNTNSSVTKTCTIWNSI